ncbi:MAG TPA: CHASE2 domain-containing protein [Ramlibacter sp.]|uniref:CHASE2 domain-containing protein n=1 Tax=Ramlibacter sp. TaxID=1917967 RepID=UPI002B7034CD|nr:CHASE2 domain-containing protein [Ramlibacter sp.]HVZ43995.1 CHASE2 domain-containing protein [Ramlibacter sp.]
MIGIRGGGAWLAAAVLVALAAALGSLQGLGSLDLALADLLRPAAPPVASRIVIVAIDDASLASVGRWPWPRLRHAELIEQLIPCAPRAIGFDVLLSEPGGAADAVLEDVMRRSGHVVLPVSSQPGGADLRPLPAFERVATLGRADIAIDEDGVVRGVPLGVRDPEHFALALVRAAGDRAVFAGWQSSEVSLIDFRAPGAGIRQISAADVLSGGFDRSIFRDAYVLVGATATGVGDAYPTPALPERGLRPGVDVLATALDAVLQGTAARRAPPWVNALANALAVLVACVLLARVRADRAWLAVLCVIAGYALTVWMVRQAAGLQLLPLAGGGLVAVAYIASSTGWLHRTIAYVRAEISRLRSVSPVQTRLTGSGLADGLKALQEQSAAMFQAKTALEESLDRLPDCVFIVDQKHSLLLANSPARRAFSIADPRAIGDFQAFLDEHLDFAAQADRSNVLARGAELVECTAGTGKRFLLRSVPRTGAAGEALGWVVTLVDGAAPRPRGALSDEALGYLSHDMRSPQVSILSLLTLRREGALAGGDEEFLDRVGRLAETTLDYADAFIQFARAESAAYAREPQFLLEILGEVADELWSKAHAAGVAISVEGDDGVVCFGDRMLLHRAMQNLLDNAIRFSPAGTSVECRLRRDDREAVLTVRDHGAGFEGDPSALFEPYRQGRDARQGAGLGLAFVRTVVQRHGGRITAANAPGGGALFRIVLPATQAAL